MLNLITNRTRADVDRVIRLAHKWSEGVITDAEKQEFLSHMKGSYSESDLNRVGAAVAVLTERLRDAGIYRDTVAKSDWQETDTFRENDLSYYLEDIHRIRSALNVLPSTPTVPADLQGLTWQEANDIEQILEDVDMLITNMEQAWFYSGDLYAGEV